MIKRTYLCPKCSNETFEKTIHDCTVFNLDFNNETTLSNGHAEQYQCQNCGYIIADEKGNPIEDIEKFSSRLNELKSFRDVSIKKNKTKNEYNYIKFIHEITVRMEGKEKNSLLNYFKNMDESQMKFVKTIYNVSKKQIKKIKKLAKDGVLESKLHGLYLNISTI